MRKLIIEYPELLAIIGIAAVLSAIELVKLFA